jgi:hypothetical protein
MRQADEHGTQEKKNREEFANHKPGETAFPPGLNLSPARLVLKNPVVVLNPGRFLFP